ncbi:MAG: hypothetical protein AAGF12_26680 [Myxococcota bacterium]
MAETRFDPGGFYEFNLAHGAVRTKDGSRVIVLTDTVVAPLVSAAVQNGDLKAVRRMGRQLGQLVRDSLGVPATSCSPEQVMGHAASVLALFGWGRLNLERWGDVLVARLMEFPNLDEGDLGVAALLGGLFSELGEREVACVPTSDTQAFILLNPTVAEQVWNWAKEGQDLPSIVGRLSQGAA